MTKELKNMALVFAAVNWAIFLLFIKWGWNPVALGQAVIWSVVFIYGLFKKETT